MVQSYYLTTSIVLLYIDYAASLKFLFTTCQAGAERALKDEFKLCYPDFSFAFSRPGLVTWKSQTEVTPDVEIKSTFARCYGASIGSFSTTEELYQEASKVLVTSKLALHVYGREEGTPRSEHPEAIKAKDARIKTLASELQEMDTYAIFTEQSAHVLDVIVGEEGEKFFLGHHIHADTYESSTPSLLPVNNKKWRNHYPYAGGIAPLVLPLEAPSRAYLKIEEAILWGGLEMAPEDTVLEIGSAPGGACYALLQRGLKVCGVDPSPPDRTHAPIVDNHPRFISIKSKLEFVDYAKLPVDVEWLLCDANISPEEAIPSLLPLLRKYKGSLKGFIYTMKLGEDLWGKISEPLIKYIARVQDTLYKSTQIKLTTSTQLASNRQEILLIGLTDKGIKSCSFLK